MFTDYGECFEENKRVLWERLIGGGSLRESEWSGKVFLER